MLALSGILFITIMPRWRLK